MTDMTLRMLLTADSDQARAELRRVASDLDRVGSEGRQAGTTAAQGLGAMAGAARQAHTAAAQGARDTAQTTTLAAGSVGNLAAQFNDIAIMMQAGQNPLQLAIQQGTQISQVIGPLGAAGAARALGAAFMSMLNPVNLVTIGAIAAGASFVNWLRRARDDADAARAEMDAMAAAMQDYKAAAEEAMAPTDALVKRFGDLAPAARQWLDTLADRKVADQMDANRASVEAFAQSLALLERDNATGRFVVPGSRGDAFPEMETPEGRAAMGRVARVPAALNAFLDATTVERQAAAMREVEAAVRAVAELNGDISASEQRRLDQLAEINVMLAEQARIEQARAADRRQADAYRTAGASMADSAESVRWADELLAKLNAQAETQRLINEFGADSVQVAEARAQAERDAFAELVNSADIAQSLKDRLMGAWDAANGVASVDMAGNITLAANEAGRLADNLSRFIAMNPITADMAAEDRLMGLPVMPDAQMRSDQQQAQFNLRRLTAPRGGSAGGGGGGGGGGGPAPGSLAALEAEAQRMLEALDLAVAGVNEKVRAGLDSTAEGTEAIAEAKRRAAEALAELIPELQRANAASGPEAEAAVARWRAALDGIVDTIGEANSASSDLKDGLKGQFEDFVAGAIQGKAAVEDLSAAIVEMFARAAAQRFTDRLISPLIDSLFGMIRFADGGVPAADLGAYRNTVVRGPTLFGMGPGKLGLMGEAGTEAILPTVPAPGGGLGIRAIGPGGAEDVLGLTRLPGGALGVQIEAFARGGVVRGDGGWRPAILDRPPVDLSFARAADRPEQARAPVRPMQINVVNHNAGAQVTAQEVPDGNGGFDLEVIVSEIEGRMAGNLARGAGALGGVLRDRYGLTRVGR